MYRITLAAFLSLASACSRESEVPVFSTMDRDTFVVEYERFSRILWEGISPLYARLEPALLDRVPERLWTEEDRTVAGCLHDTLSERGKMTALDRFATNRVEAIRAIAADLLSIAHKSGSAACVAGIRCDSLSCTNENRVGVIPTAVIDHCSAQSRVVIDVTRSLSLAKKFHASQQASTMSS